MFQRRSAIKMTTKGNSPLNMVDGVPSVEGVSVSKLAQHYGTPIFVVSLGTIAKNYRRIFSAFSAAKLNASVFYSMKTNNNRVICDCIRALGGGIEVVSEHELSVAQSVGYVPSKILYNAPCKKTEDIETAVKLKVRLITCDSMQELAEIDRVCGKVGVNQKVGIRIDPEADRDSKFGFSVKEAIEVADSTLRLHNIRLSAIHFHLGTRILSPRPYYESVRAAVRVINSTDERVQDFLECIDIGGGLPSFFDLQENGLDILSYAASVRRAIEPLRIPNKVRIFVEPGRAVVGDAVLCLASVTNLKKLKGVTWAILDVGINALPRLASANYKFLSFSTDSRKDRVASRLGGPLCMKSDTFGDDGNLVTVGVGDLVGFTNAGAYTMSLTTGFSESHPRLVVVNGKRHKQTSW